MVDAVTEPLLLLHVSASQVKTKRRCERKWYWEKIRGFRSPSSRAAELGKHIHSLLEHYLETGNVPTHLFDPTYPEGWRVALPGLENIPRPPIPKRQIERALYLTCFAKPVYGFVDLLVGPLEVDDHKTTSDFRYQRSPEELRHDPQAIIYGSCATALWSQEPDRTYLDEPATTVAFPNYSPVTFRHVYYRTRGAPRSAVTSVDLTADDLSRGLDALGVTIDEMVALSLEDSAKAAEPNLSACGDFRGCPHLARCNALGDMSMGLQLFGKKTPLFAKDSKDTAAKRGLNPASLGLFGKKEGAVGAFSKKTKKDAAPKAEGTLTARDIKILKLVWEYGPQGNGEPTLVQRGLLEQRGEHYYLSEKGVAACLANGCEGEPKQASPGVGDPRTKAAQPSLPIEEPAAEKIEEASEPEGPSISDDHKAVLKAIWTTGPLAFCDKALVEAGLVRRNGDGKYILTLEGAVYCQEVLGLKGEWSKGEPRSAGSSGTSEPEPPVEPSQGAGAAINPPDGTPMDQQTDPPEQKRGRKAAMRSPIEVPGTIAKGDSIKSTMGKPGMVALRKALVAHLPGTDLYYSLSDFAGSKELKTDLYADIFLLVQIHNGETPTKPDAVDKRHDNVTPDPEPAPSGAVAAMTATTPEAPASSAPEPAKPQETSTSTTTAKPSAREMVQDVAEKLLAPVLYLDCVPLRARATRLETWLAPVFAMIEAGKVAPGDEPVEHWSQLGFADDQKRLRQGLHRALKQGTLAFPPHLVVSSALRCAAVVEVLTPHYEAHGWEIVQGVK